MEHARNIKHGKKSESKDLKPLGKVKEITDSRRSRTGWAGKEHEYCLRCGRRLKTPEARRIGYGDVCLLKMKRRGKSLF